jgi:hypothetical protein
MLSRGVPSAEILWLHDLFKNQNSKICKKGPKAKKLRPNILEAKFG